MDGQTLMLPIQVRTMIAENIKISVPYVTGGTTASALELINNAITATNQKLLQAQGYPSPDIQEMNGLYAIVPYAWGFPYFPISVFEIQDIIDEGGPLGELMY